MATTKQQTSDKPKRGRSAPSRLSEKVFDYVVENIVAGRFEPSMQITERDLAKKLGMSHVPVREAIERLEQHAWVERIPHKGTYIRSFDRDEQKATYQIREVVETGAVHIVAEAVTAEQLAELDAAVGAIESAHQANDANAYQEADIRFHRLLVQFTGNTRLEDFFESVVMQSCFAYSAFLRGAMRVVFNSSLEEHESRDPAGHRQIHDALAAHDAQRAVDLVRQHARRGYALATTMEKIREVLKS